MKTYSIRDQILVAKTVTEVEQLLSKALAFKYALPRTLRRIERAAKERVVALGGSR